MKGFVFAAALVAALCAASAAEACPVAVGGSGVVVKGQGAFVAQGFAAQGYVAQSHAAVVIQQVPVASFGACAVAVPQAFVPAQRGRFRSFTIQRTVQR